MNSLICNYIFSGIKCNIIFENKVNILFDNSGTGKTFMFTILQSYLEEKEIKYILVDSRSSLMNNEELLLEGIDNSEVVLLDNADLYLSQVIINAIQAKGKLAIISLKSLSAYRLRGAGLYKVHYDKDELVTRRMR